MRKLLISFFVMFGLVGLTACSTQNIAGADSTESSHRSDSGEMKIGKKPLAADIAAIIEPTINRSIIIAGFDPRVETKVIVDIGAIGDISLIFNNTENGIVLNEVKIVEPEASGFQLSTGRKNMEFVEHIRNDIFLQNVGSVIEAKNSKTIAADIAKSITPSLEKVYAENERVRIKSIVVSKDDKLIVEDNNADGVIDFSE